MGQLTTELEGLLGFPAYLGSRDAVLHTPSTSISTLLPGDLNIIGATQLMDPGNPVVQIPDSTTIPDQTTIYALVILAGGSGEQVTFNAQGTDIFSIGGPSFVVKDQSALISLKFPGEGVLLPGVRLWFGLPQYIAIQRANGVDLGDVSGSVSLPLVDANNFRCRLTGNATLSLQSAGADWIPNMRGRIEVEQDGFGGHTLSWANASFTNRFDGGVPPTHGGAPNSIDIFEYAINWNGAFATIRKVGSAVA